MRKLQRVAMAVALAAAGPALPVVMSLAQIPGVREAGDRRTYEGSSRHRIAKGRNVRGNRNDGPFGRKEI
jgi:hypothetical protein